MSVCLRTSNSAPYKCKLLGLSLKVSCLVDQELDLGICISINHPFVIQMQMDHTLGKCTALI